MPAAKSPDPGNGGGSARDQPPGGFAYAAAEFTVVKPRKKRKNNKRAALNDRLAATPVQSLQRVRDAMREKDAWLADASRVLSGALAELALDGRADLDVLCLGLGSPTSSLNSNAQLAFLLEVTRHLNLAPDRVSLYDPVFTEEDKTLFAHLQLNVLSENKDGRYALTSPTLCIMLHCDMELYNALLETNWSAAGLRNLILVGNRLAEYLDNNPSHRLRARVPYLVDIAPALACREISPAPQWPTAFNNTCVQFVPPPPPAGDDALEAVLRRAGAEKEKAQEKAADASTDAEEPSTREAPRESGKAACV